MERAPPAYMGRPRRKPPSPGRQWFVARRFPTLVAASSFQPPLQEPRYRVLLLKAEIREVVVLHHVALRLDAHLVGMLRLRFATGGDEVVVANDLHPDESLLDVSVDRTTRFLRRSALANQPGAVLRAADREKTDVAARAHHADQKIVERRRIRRLGYHYRFRRDKCVRLDE